MSQHPNQRQLGIGFSYEEIQEKCKKVVGPPANDKDGEPEFMAGLIPSVPSKDPDSAGHIVNVDEPKHVTFSQRKAAEAKERRKSVQTKRRQRKRSTPYHDDSEVLRRRMSRFGGGGVFPGNLKESFVRR